MTSRSWEEGIQDFDPRLARQATPLEKPHLILHEKAFTLFYYFLLNRDTVVLSILNPQKHQNDTNNKSQLSVSCGFTLTITALKLKLNLVIVYTTEKLQLCHLKA